MRSSAAVLLYALLLSALLAPPGAGAGAAEDLLERGHDLLDRGHDLLDRGKAKAALEVFRELETSREEEAVPALLGQGMALYQLRRYDEAAARARRALPRALRPEDQVQVLYLLGVALGSDPGADAGDLVTADRALERAVDLTGGAVPRILLEHALVLAARDEGRKAMLQARAAVEAAGPGEPSREARILYCALGSAVGYPADDSAARAEPPPSELPLLEFLDSEVQPSAGREAEEEAEADRRPRVVHKEAPVYPLSAVEINMEGRVGFRALVSSEGCVVRTEPLEPVVEALTPAAAVALGRWVFDPAREDGEPVPAWVKVWFDYRSGFTQRDYEHELLWRRNLQTTEGLRQIIR